MSNRKYDLLVQDWREEITRTMCINTICKPEHYNDLLVQIDTLAKYIVQKQADVMSVTLGVAGITNQKEIDKIIHSLGLVPQTK